MTSTRSSFPDCWRACANSIRARSPDRDGIDVLLDLQVLRHDDSDESEVGGILRPTLAGLLALGRYPQKFYPRLGISIAVFPGTSRDDVFRGDERLVASKSVVGSIPVMIDDAVDSLMRWIGAKKPDYPPLVLREAIANALTHRDYSPDARGTQVHISVFTDRIEITNPGGLYGMVTHDVLASPHPVTARRSSPPETSSCSRCWSPRRIRAAGL